MSLDIPELLRRHQGQNYDLLGEHINPQFAKVLRIIGFDHCYVKAQGAHLWDVQGNRFLDMLGGYAVHNVGRNHPVVRQALVDFLAEDYPTLVQMDAPLLAGVLAGELKRRMPNGLDRVFLTNSGTEGIEGAIKFARGATGRPGLIFARGAFHGLSNGSLSLNGDEMFREGFGPFLPGGRQVPYDDLAALEEALAPRDVAAFVVEPVQGKGARVPTDGYLRDAAALCREHGTLFVADEVQTGVGRTGRFLGLEHDGDVDPDIVVLSKALSGGYVPTGAILTRQNIWEKVFSTMERSVVHSSTFNGGSLAMVAALATLRVLDDERLMENATRMGGLIQDGVRQMIPEYEFLHSVRGRGLILGIELGKPQSLALRTAWSLIHKMDTNLFPQAAVIPLMEDHRILTQVTGHNVPVIKLIPPLVIDEEDVRWFLDGFRQVMDGMHQFPGPVWDLMKRLGKHVVTRRPRDPVADS